MSLTSNSLAAVGHFLLSFFTDLFVDKGVGAGTSSFSVHVRIWSVVRVKSTLPSSYVTSILQLSSSKYSLGSLPANLLSRDLNLTTTLSSNWNVEGGSFFALILHEYWDVQIVCAIRSTSHLICNSCSPSSWNKSYSLFDRSREMLAGRYVVYLWFHPLTLNSSLSSPISLSSGDRIACPFVVFVGVYATPSGSWRE